MPEQVPERLYLMTFKDQKAAWDVRKTLEGFSASVTDPCEIVRNGRLPETHRSSVLIVITVHCGDLDEHVCVSRSIGEARARGFHVSHAFDEIADLAFVPILTVRQVSAGSEDLKEAIRNLHYTDDWRTSAPRSRLDPNREYMLR